MNKIINFIDLTMAILTGDDNKVIAAKNWRKADSAFTSHIANLKGKTVELEDNLQEAQENFKLALANNGKPISNSKDYITNVIQARNNVTLAQTTLDDHNEELRTLTEIHEGLNPQTTAI